MPTRELLSPAQRAQFTTLPDPMSERDLARHYTFTTEDLAVIQQRRGDHNRLGFGVQLAYLRFPGRPLGPGEQVPTAILAYLAAQLAVDPAVMAHYARDRDATRREHLLEIQAVFQFRPFTPWVYRELARWLQPIALRTDAGVALVAALIDEMRARKIVAPALSTLERLAWEVRRRARLQVFTQLADSLTPAERQHLDQLLIPPPGRSQTQLAWLRQPPGPPTPGQFLKLIERLIFIRSLQLNGDVVRQIHQNRVLQLAREGMRTTPQHLQRFDAQRRYAILVAFLLDTAATLTDAALVMHDRILGSIFNQVKRDHAAQFQASGTTMKEQVRRFVHVGKALIAARATDSDPYLALEAVMDWTTFLTTVAEAEQVIQPLATDEYDLLDDHYSQVRRYAPTLLETFTFKGAPASQSLLAALDLLKRMNAGELKKVPPFTPLAFVKPRWEEHVCTVKGVDRHYYELCALTELRNGLRSGDVWVVGSRQFRAFEDYLLPEAAWQTLKTAGPLPLPVPTDFATYLAERQEALHTQLQTVATLAAEQALPDVKLSNGKLSIARLQKAVPDGVDEFVRRAYALVPRIKLTDLLIEVDASTGFSRHFTHLRSGETVKNPAVLYAVILADAINLGLTKMADACPGMSFEQLAWVADWYVRDEGYSRALAEIINRHHRLPFATQWGDGTTSSSDGQRYPMGGRREATGQVIAKYGRDPGVLVYTHLSDQYGPFHVKVINTTSGEAPYVLDGLLYHETLLQIKEHYTDTGGFTDHVFAMCHLQGFRFAPRIRDLSELRLYTLEAPATYPALAPIMGGTLNVKRMREQWDEILRLASSVRIGTVSASLILRKLSAYPRQNGLAWALRELGRLDRTLFELDWLQSPELRRRVQVGLNKGEARNALARAVFFNRLGEVRDRSYEDQRYRASGLNLVLAAITLWNTIYLTKAVETLRAQGMEIPDDYLPHLSPLGWEHIALTGDYHWDLQQRTNLDRLRPLRVKEAGRRSLA